MLAYRGIPGGFEDEDEDNDNLDFLISSTHQLKITVVPDITAGAGLNGEDFDSALSADMDKWFEDFKETYNKCKFHTYICTYMLRNGGSSILR